MYAWTHGRRDTRACEEAIVVVYDTSNSMDRRAFHHSHSTSDDSDTESDEEESTEAGGDTRLSRAEAHFELLRVRYVCARVCLRVVETCCKHEFHITWGMDLSIRRGLIYKVAFDPNSY